MLWVLLTCFVACDNSKSPQTKKQSPELSPIRILVVDDSDLAASIESAWEAQGERPIKVTSESSDKLTAAKRLRADVVIFPSNQLGQYVEADLIARIPEEQLSRRGGEEISGLQGLLTPVRYSTITWGRTPYAYPLSEPAFVLLYRQDIFKKLGLNPPATWKEYLELAKRLDDRSSLSEFVPSDADWTGALEPNEGLWPAHMVFARAVSYSRHETQTSVLFDFGSFDPYIHREHFVRAASEWLDSAKSISTEKRRDLTPRDVAKEFFEGKCAMALTWIGATGTDENKVAVGFAEPPGAKEFFDLRSDSWKPRETTDDGRFPLPAIMGRLCGVTKEAGRPSESWRFVEWLTTEGARKATPFDFAERGPVRSSDLDNSQLLLPRGVEFEAVKSFADVVGAFNRRTLFAPTLRMRGGNRYLQVLAEEIRVSRDTGRPVKESLAKVNELWREVTNSLEPGAEGEKLATSKLARSYRRNLGSEY